MSKHGEQTRGSAHSTGLLRVEFLEVCQERNRRTPADPSGVSFHMQSRNLHVCRQHELPVLKTKTAHSPWFFRHCSCSHVIKSKWKLFYSCPGCQLNKTKWYACNMHELYEMLYQEMRQYFSNWDWVGLKWLPVLKVQEQHQDNHRRVMQNSYR